ncbi:Endothelin-converting enzyme 1 [Nymphon striatum]|nr:Endothelin-converting enzyme 1 [Nymphon striatum]
MKQGDSYPCDDLWSYSCGNWLKKNPVPHYAGKFSVADQTTRNLYIKLRHLIDLVPLLNENEILIRYDPRVKGEEHFLIHKAGRQEKDEEYYKPEVKVKKFYSTCVNLNYIESSDDSPLSLIILELKGWDVFGSFISQTFNKDKLIRDLHVEYGVSPYFKIDVVSNPKDAGKSIIKAEMFKLVFAINSP